MRLGEFMACFHLAYERIILNSNNQAFIPQPGDYLPAKYFIHMTNNSGMILREQKDEEGGIWYWFNG